MELSLTNFRRYKKQAFSFGKDVTKITGDSGSGKSTILDSIYYCLYGKLQKVKPHDGKGQTEVIFVFPYKDTTITVRRGNKSDIQVWIGENETYEGDQAQGVIDGWFGNAESFLMSSYLKAETMHKFISATPSEKKEITYLLFPGVADCESYTTKLKSAKKQEEDLIHTQENRRTRLLSSIATMVRNHPWLSNNEDIEIEDIVSLLPIYGLEGDNITHSDVQKRARECSTILAKYQILNEQCVEPSSLDVDAAQQRVDEIQERLSHTTSSYSDIQRKIGDASTVLSRYRAILESNVEPPPLSVDEYRQRLRDIEDDILRRKMEIRDGDVPSLSSLQREIRDCYSVLGRYEVLAEQDCPPAEIDMEGLQSRLKDLRAQILSSHVSTESRESKLSYLRGTLQTLEQDYNPDCIKDYDLTRKLHSLCQSYEGSKKKIVDIEFQIQQTESTLADYTESLEAIEYNSRLTEPLTCPSCKASLRHTDTLHLESDDDIPRTVLYNITKDDVERLRLNFESQRAKHKELIDRINDYEKILLSNPHIPSLLEKHGSVVLYNRYITEMKNKKERIDTLVADINSMLDDDTKYVSQDEIDVLNDECNKIEETLSAYRSDITRYGNLRSQIQSLVDKNKWLEISGRDHIKELEQLAQKITDLDLFISSSKDESDSLLSKITSYDEAVAKYDSMKKTLTSMLGIDPWLEDGENYINDLEGQSRDLLERQKEDERLRKECVDIENSISRYNNEMSLYLSNMSKVTNIISQHPWLEKGETYVQELDSLTQKMMDHSKKVEMKRIQTSYLSYTEKLEQTEKTIETIRSKVEKILRLLALVNEAYTIYVDDKMKEIEHDITILGKLFFDESMNISIVYEKGERPSFDLHVEHEGVVYDDVKTMSTGERKRLSLIMMIVIAKYLDAKIMMLDEAFSSIGPDARGVILDQLSKMGITLLLTSHDSLPGAYFEVLDLNNLQQ